VTVSQPAPDAQECSEGAGSDRSQGRFSGRVAYVTGAASGIGAAIVDGLIRDGARVAGADVADQSALIERHGDAYLPLTADVTSEEAIASSIAATVAAFGPIDLAFPVAGAHRGGPIETMDRTSWDFTLGLVLTGVFLTVKHAAGAMRDGGAITTIGSINGRVPMRGGAAYVAAKAGVEAFTRTAALELGERGIRVNCVMPGLIETPLTATFRGIPAVHEAFSNKIVLGRPGRPEEIVQPVLFLASDDASYVTGASLMVDGGWDVANYPDLRGLVEVPRA